MKTVLKKLIVVAAVLPVAGLVHGQITVDGFASWSLGGSPITGTFDASSSDKLVVIVTGEHSFPNNTGGNCSSVTYDGVPLTRVVDRNPVSGSDITYNDIWYLDFPSTSGGQISATVTSRGSMTVLGISGTAEEVGNTVIGAANSNSANLLTSAGSIVIASYGMGGNGNSADYAGVDTNAPLTEISALGNGNWDGHVVGYALGVAAGNATYSFNDSSTTGAHVIAAEFLLGPPPPELTVEVNVNSGSMLVRGDDADPVSIRYYELTSAGHSLTTAGWNSLAAQDYDGNGPPNGSGDGWEEAGGSDAGTLAEAYLLGESTLPAGGQISLGTPYRTGVDARDLNFRYLNERGRIYDANVVYITAADLYADAAAQAGLSGPDAGPEAVPFQDGVVNLLKYAFNMNLGGYDLTGMTTGTGTSGLPVYSVVEDGGQHFFRVEYVRRLDSGLIYVPKYSTDFGSMVPMTGPETVDPIDANWERVTASQPIDPATTPHCFGVVEVTLP